MRHIRILITDEDAPLLKRLEALLRKRGYSVKTCADKQKALQILNADSCDILICPAPNTTENGDSLPVQARLLRPEISVLLMTDKTCVKRSKTTPGFTADETLAKPFSQSLFLSTLERAYWRSLTRRDEEENL